MARMTLNVIVPASMPNPGTGAPIPDPVPKYLGEALERQTPPPRVGGATILSGTLLGNKFVGCTYVSGPYAIPGFGEIEIGGPGSGASVATRARR